MYELLITKTVVCHGEFHHIAEGVAYIFKILILINFENISIATTFKKPTLITRKKSLFTFNVI